MGKGSRTVSKFRRTRARPTHIRTTTDDARDLFELAKTDPLTAQARAEQLLAESSDFEALATGRYALGMALRTQFKLDEAQRTLQQASDEALAAGYESLGGRALLTLSGACAMAGQMDDAFSTAARAREHLEGADLAACEAQMATFLYHQD